MYDETRSSYYESDKRYPVIYYLHGYNEPSSSFYLTSSINDLNKAFENSDKEFIMVGCDGCNSLNGSFYANSPVIGNWEDHITKEVIDYIDSNYRTIAKPESRGICGISMGGFGALKYAFSHPDIYGAVYAMSPSIAAEEKTYDVIKSFCTDPALTKAYSYAYAPSLSEPFGLIPAFDGSKEDNDIIEQWANGIGNWREKLDAYLALDTPLRAIGLSYGDQDPYLWISEGDKDFAKLLDEYGLTYTLCAFQGGHNPPPNSIKDHIIPFFTDALIWE